MTKTRISFSLAVSSCFTTKMVRTESVSLRRPEVVDFNQSNASAIVQSRQQRGVKAWRKRRGYARRSGQQVPARRDQVVDRGKLDTAICRDPAQSAIG